MRRIVVLASVPLTLACAACGVGSGEDAVDSALTPTTSPHRVPEVREAKPDAGSSAEDAAVAGSDEVGAPDTTLGPIGHCLNGGFDWTCRAGRTCTFTGHCTPADAGASSAGSQPCGLIFCDLAYCRCRSAGASLCDCD